MTLKFTNRARKDLQKLPRKAKAQVREAIRLLARDPYRGIKLSGPWEGYRRVRSGDYRIIYRIYDDELIVHYVRPRKAAYRR
ncbi:MAG: type II toxin-antitoxin system RelE/ParE family toxin [Candidatus Bipolaricaulota bacterium]|nr:type II toxin-antitoxin system RelE/ParE family toxin [Candidatus Bipolaricaulota bacterium]